MREKCFHATAGQTVVREMNVQIAATGTVAGDLLSLPLKVLGAVGPERRESPQLLEPIEECLLLLLCMGCQNLLSQAQFLVGLPLLAGR